MNAQFATLLLPLTSTGLKALAPFEQRIRQPEQTSLPFHFCNHLSARESTSGVCEDSQIGLLFSRRKFVLTNFRAEAGRRASAPKRLRHGDKYLAVEVGIQSA